MCMQVCVCQGLFVCWLELTYNCVWFGSGLCFARVLFFTLLFFVYYVCLSLFCFLLRICLKVFVFADRCVCRIHSCTYICRRKHICAFLRAWNHAHMCMQVCLCYGLFVCWLELTYNCLWLDSGLRFARVVFFTLLLCVCRITFDMVVLYEAMLICLSSSSFVFNQYTMYIL